MNNSYILLDIDGCVTDGKNQHINVLACHQLQEFIKTQQLNVLLCTGRSAVYTEAICQLLHIDNWCICENGCYLYHPITDEIQVNPMISPADIDYLKKLNIELSTNQYKNLFKIELGKEICISLNPISMNIQSLYELICPLLDLSKVDVTHSTTAVDITPKNINKGDGYDFWYNFMNIQDIKTIGIGDSKGDIPFLQKCDLVACPNNATPEVKNISSIIAQQNSTLGVLEIMQILAHRP